MAAVKNGREYLSHVTESLKHRIAQLDESIEAGQKEIEGMHEYYWENYTEMDQYGYENFDNQQALLHEINASTVSYTHLDVYKRQVRYIIWNS